jgi:hypothetical protein
VVQNPRAPLGARGLRRLNVPVPIGIDVDESGRPRAVQRSGWPRPRAVVRIQDRWRIDDEWWRARPSSRDYYSLLLDDDTLLTVYRDRIVDAWLEQRDGNGAGLR